MHVERIAVVGAAAVLVALVAPAPGSAHLRTGSVAVGYRANVLRPRPSSKAVLTVGVYQSDRALHITVAAGHRVVVIGYLGEPFLRADSAGVAVNLGSPTAAVAGLLPKTKRTTQERTVWLRRHGGRSMVWHDPRLQRLPPGIREAPWTVPILVDGRRETITGELSRVPRPSPWPWLVSVLPFMALAAWLGLKGPEGRLRSSCIALGILSAVGAMITAAAFAFGTYASPGTWIAALDEFAFAAAGVGVLLRGPSSLHLPAGIWLSLLGLAVGLSKSEVFLYGLVLSALPGTATRVAATLAITTGLAGSALGGLHYLRTDSVEHGARSVSLSRPS